MSKMSVLFYSYTCITANRKMCVQNFSPLAGRLLNKSTSECHNGFQKLYVMVSKIYTYSNEGFKCPVIRPYNN